MKAGVVHLARCWRTGLARGRPYHDIDALEADFADMIQQAPVAGSFRRSRAVAVGSTGSRKDVTSDLLTPLPAPPCQHLQDL